MITNDRGPTGWRRRSGRLRAFAGMTVVVVVWMFSGCSNDIPDCPKDDHNPCTLDGCDAGKAVNEQLEDWHPCFIGQLKGACHAGVCVIQCESSKQCDDAIWCTKGRCEGGVCIIENVDEELPSAGNACEERGCVDGEIVTWPKPDGALCVGETGTCTGGVCSCSTISDCGFATECRKWRCEENKCVPIFTLFGTELSVGNFLGDCRRPICDGKGGVIEEQDLNDKPASYDPCYEWTCIGTTPLRTPIIGKTCVMDSGLIGYCDAGGACVQCIQDLDCGPEARCEAGVCLKCGDAFPNGAEICGGSCGACIGTACVDDGDCASGHCVGTNGIPAKVCCDAPCDGICQDCGTDGKCGAVLDGQQDADTCYFPDMACKWPQCRYKAGHPCVLGSDCVSNNCDPNTKTCK